MSRRRIHPPDPLALPPAPPSPRERARASIASWSLGVDAAADAIERAALYSALASIEVVAAAMSADEVDAELAMRGLSSALGAVRAIKDMRAMVAAHDAEGEFAGRLALHMWDDAIIASREPGMPPDA